MENGNPPPGPVSEVVPSRRRLAPSLESRAKAICQLRIHLASIYILGYLKENVNKGHKVIIFGPPLMDVWLEICFRKVKQDRIQDSQIVPITVILNQFLIQ